ncbi:MAG: LppX_LprAFG lipoprotein [Nocardioidaceae bacterium]|nr:LppX_LprAFG lipoprotein [Nocardioidaceae bacterium]
MRKLLATAAVLVVSVAGCKGSEDAPAPDLSLEERLVEAKRDFDEAEFIDFTLATESLPDGLPGLLSASGTGTHDPAFTGKVDVATGAVPLNDTNLIAVDGRVYVDLPFIGWTDLDPSDYGAPDPADLMDTEGGISSLFTATEDLVEGESERDGETVLTSIDGTIPGSAVEEVFPSAGTEPFDVSYTLTDDNALEGAKITGLFYGGSDQVTYTLDLDLDGDPVDIVAP